MSALLTAKETKINFIAHKEVLMFQNKTHLAELADFFLSLSVLFCFFLYFACGDDVMKISKSIFSKTFHQHTRKKGIAIDINVSFRQHFYSQIGEIQNVCAHVVQYQIAFVNTRDAL